MNATRLISFLSGFLAIIFNLLLVFIIIKKSSQRLGKYKYFLLAYSLNACYFSLGQISILPTWYIPVDGFFFYSTVTIFPRWLQQIQFVCFISSYMFNVIILGWCFLYRLAVIQNDDPWILTRSKFRITFLISVVLAAYMTGTCALIHPTDSADQMFHDEMLEIANMELAEIAYIGGQLTIDGQLNIALSVCFTSYLVFLVIASLGLAVCWYKIGSNLKKMRDISCAKYRFQKKLFILLTLQTSLPIMFNLIPCAIVMGLGLANIHAQNVVTICAMVLSFAQLCDPIFTVVLVTDYKKAIFQLLNKAAFYNVTLPVSISNSAALGDRYSRTRPTN